MADAARLEFNIPVQVLNTTLRGEVQYDSRRVFHLLGGQIYPVQQARLTAVEQGRLPK